MSKSRLKIAILQGGVYYKSQATTDWTVGHKWLFTQTEVSTV